MDSVYRWCIIILNNLMDNILDIKLKEFSDKFDLAQIDFSKYWGGRTLFQLEKFVMNEHDKPERQFLQLMMELKSIRDGFIGDCFEVEKLKIQIQRLLATNDELDTLEAIRKQYLLRQLEENSKFREREIMHIVKLMKSLPKIYTYEEIEEAECAYWEKRLTRQAFEDMLCVQTGINQGNIRSNIQANTSMAAPFLDFKEKSINSLINSTTHYIK